jgi:ribosomal protein S18 acetylase RimI-like enzyme
MSSVQLIRLQRYWPLTPNQKVANKQYPIKFKLVAMAKGTPHILNNPIWHALTSSQAYVAKASHLARRFPSDITTLAGFSEPTRETFRSLLFLTEPDEVAALFLESAPAEIDGWAVVEVVPLLQMLHEGFGLVVSAVQVEELNATHVPQMLRLAELTNPGPFGRRTPELGTYLGVRQRGALVAMAGERLRIPGYVEVSAVCTYREHCGRGYASALVGALVQRIHEQAAVPFLHVRAENRRAVELYERLGFKGRVIFQLTVLRRNGPVSSPRILRAAPRRELTSQPKSEA